MRSHSFRRLWMADMILFGGTRVALGLGAGLLLARRMNNDQRKAAGIALVSSGALTTIPLVMRFRAYRQWRKDREAHHNGECRCGCPHCCPPEEESQKPASSPAA